MKKSLAVLWVALLAFACSSKAHVAALPECDDTIEQATEKDGTTGLHTEKTEVEETAVKVVPAPDSEENGGKELAIDPKTCKVTHCKTFPGFEDRGLECVDSDLLHNKGYRYGDKVLEGKRVKYGGERCAVTETEPVCFIGLYGLQRDISKYGVTYCDPRNCIIEDYSQCDEANHQTDLAVDPKTCVVTHCKAFPGFEDRGLACNTSAILKAGYALGNEVLHIYDVAFGEADVCDTIEGELSEACYTLKIQCFLDPKKHAKAVHALGWDACDACILKR